MKDSGIVDYLLRRYAEGRCGNCVIHDTKRGPSSKQDECQLCYYEAALPKGVDE